MFVLAMIYSSLGQCSGQSRPQLCAQKNDLKRAVTLLWDDQDRCPKLLVRIKKGSPAVPIKGTTRHALGALGRRRVGSGPCGPCGPCGRCVRVGGGMQSEPDHSMEHDYAAAPLCKRLHTTLGLLTLQRERGPCTPRLLTSRPSPMGRSAKYCEPAKGNSLPGWKAARQAFHAG